jgi:hypothetical protein
MYRPMYFFNLALVGFMWSASRPRRFNPGIYRIGGRIHPEPGLYIYIYRERDRRGRETTVSVVSWSEFLSTDPDARVRFPALPEKKR